MLGTEVADWLRDRIDPSQIYDHRTLDELRPLGIIYVPDAHVLYMATGETVGVPTYAPADLVRHPVIAFGGLSDEIDTRWIPGFEIAHVLHLLLWPHEIPPGRPENGWVESYQADVRSIADRGALSYRQKR